ncbi:MAG: M1 family peptidase [Bacteroidetes bacterium]|nr:MAG: M1 family peptidase [Bacteroidota bacterium]
MRAIHILIFLLTSLLSYAQYWQQEVNYRIDVQLDDVNHVLSAFEEFEYINHSPDVLNKIYIHLWPNAYRNKNTALAKQLYHSGETDLTFETEALGGFIDSLDFKVNGEKANWEYHPDHIDIAIIHLKEGLQPEQSIRISTPFKVKIPSGSISRLGHIGQSYQITQWYPKPAVYDKEGWHPIPYLNQGEFYSEYGSFDVSIRLPKNYVVGATGDLQNPEEIAFLDSISKKTREELPKAEYNKLVRAKTPNSYPESSKTYKTIRYVQNNVHDFAWFADKRYQVLKSEVKVPHSGRTVTSWAMFTPRNASLWKDASEYLNDAIYYYSLWNGDYPYNQVTAVDGTISAGGGMEYPNVTVIGNSSNEMQLEIVIVHEVGHNWFYGQLGTNERVHGWMDEGMNTLNEVRYVQTKYPENTALSDMVMNGKFHFNDLDHHDMSDFSYRMISLLGEDQPIETHSADFTPANYGVVMYQKTGLVFFYLKDYLGEELFDECMRNYYAEWEFKHPTPYDMRASLEKTSGKNLDWLFEDLIQTTKHVNYKLKRVKQTDNGYEVKVKNVGQVDGPIEVNAILGDSVVATQWIEPGKKVSSTQLSVGHADQIVIDAGNDIPEIYRQDNNWHAKGIFKKIERPSVEFMLGDNERDRSNIFWSPMIAGNVYDRTMLGLAIHNFGVPPNRINFHAIPMYSFGRKMVSGIGEISKTCLPAHTLKQSRIGVALKSFKNDSTFRDNDSYFVAVLPYWYAKLGNRGPAKPYSQFVRLQTLYRYDQMGPSKMEHAGAYFLYNFDYNLPDHKINFALRNDYVTNLTTEESYARITGEATYKFRYMKRNRKRWISIRVFGGHQYVRDFAGSNFAYSMSLAGMSGIQDIFVDEYYFGRSEASGTWSQQRQENLGGFKSNSYYGTTAFGMASSNLYLQLPLPGNLIGAFADAGVFHNGVNVHGAFQTGLAIRVADFFGVYYPLYMSQQLNDSFGDAKYAEKIRFTFKLNILNKPLNLGSLI